MPLALIGKRAVGGGAARVLWPTQHRRIATGPERVAVIPTTDAGQIQTFLDRREKGAGFLEHPGQAIHALFGQVAKGIVIFSDQPLVGLHIASVFPLKQNFPAAEGLQEVALVVVIRRGVQAPRRLLLRGYCADQHPVQCLPDCRCGHVAFQTVCCSKPKLTRHLASQ